MSRHRHSKHSISYSIAYVRVCEWARRPNMYAQPTPDMLAMAKIYAISIEDQFILEVIVQCHLNNEIIEDTPTPDRPGSTNEALKSVKIKAFRPPIVELGPRPIMPVGATYCLGYDCKKSETK